MTFLELHQLIKEDSLLYDKVKKMFPLTWKKLKYGDSLLKKPREVILLKQGLLVEEKESKRLTSYCRIFTEKQFIFSMTGTMTLRALEGTTYSVLSADRFFDQLEEQKLLSNLFLQLQEDLEKELEQELQFQWCNVEERIELQLQRLIQKHQLNPMINPTFPLWLNIKNLACFVRSSDTMTSRRIEELANQGLIDAKSTPWRLLQTLPETVM
ncbi:Crp/Fnr family transcriptional regulator [Listeria monocytogenes]|nr:Crp/Fnr family transcriptional regulator [Listeria monocytogenes]EAF5405610.1 Crp/Fnr family transcriptional regulator [Listeria monocytogenes]EAG4727472.1 Crp/Fnr family transcriptional regulator [Listeria monocytogenes]EAG5553991.1 Crp/Fnr family transcriptional regulator [Listeria monocytogenes]ECC0367864.1 Crp/Fnr family transcriptional regulator [Listeria monocytogenes]